MCDCQASKTVDSWGVAMNGAIYPTCHAYYELRTKNENRRTKEEQKSTDEGRKTKIKGENRRTKIALLGHRNPGGLPTGVGGVSEWAVPSLAWPPD